MIIKKINIIAFGGIKNKEINFNEGMNLVYGENEAGKSTIQSFIKVWLYGFSNYKGKDYSLNERIKYTPSSGDIISGELYIEFENRQYIIRRTFGRSKKEDTSIIIDAITGEEVSYISKEEPGKYFFNINRATFANTLFIGQLGVSVKKDKEEEILDKLANSIGVEDGQVSIDIAFKKLDKYKKSLSNIRKNGQVDILNDKYSNLLSERYEAYKLSNHNLDNEEKLIRLNEEKININNEIINLDIYKKFLKKSKLQKEFQEITQYFKKREELKNKENSIRKLLTYKDEVINYRFIKDLREEYNLYLSLLDLSNVEKENIISKEEEFERLKKPLTKYDYINRLPDNVMNILENLKIRNEVLKEKVNINKSIENDISFLEFKKSEAQKLIGDTVFIKDFREDIDTVINKYEENLKELKYLVETGVNKNNNIFIFSLLGIFILSLFLGFIIKLKMLSFFLYVISGVSISTLLVNFWLNKSGKSNNKKVELIKNNINEIEKSLKYYCDKLNINNYTELFKKIKLYDDYIKLQEKINYKIKEKLSQRELLSLDKALNEYTEVNEEIKDYLRISSMSSLEELMANVKMYNHESKDFINLEVEINNLKNNLNKTMEQLSIRENKIRKNLSLIGFENINILEVDEVLKELENKLNLRQQINRDLASVEEAYLALTKGKNIDLIKEELSDIINIDFTFSYESEEQIDDVMKSKNLRLVEVEKEIKDIEYEIKNRFNGKRTIPTIEEEIKEIENELVEGKKQLRASNIAVDTLKEAYEEVRSSFGPILNKNVVLSFENFTSGKYTDVMVSDNYEMKVRNENNIMQANILSNGANDQLYLSLRLAFIEMIFRSKNVSLYLDDAFVQYDDKRIEKTIKYLVKENFKQCILFTCQRRERNILIKNNIIHKYINL